MYETYLCKLAETSLTEKTYCRNATHSFSVKKQQQTSSSITRICLQRQNNFPLSSRNSTEKQTQTLLLYTVIPIQRARKIDSISIYDINIPVAHLMANATSHRFTLMLYFQWTAINYLGRAGRQHEKVLKCFFPNCRHCRERKPRNDHLCPMISLDKLLYSTSWLVLTGPTRHSTAPQDVILDLLLQPEAPLFGKCHIATQKGPLAFTLWLLHAILPKCSVLMFTSYLLLT